MDSLGIFFVLRVELRVVWGIFFDLRVELRVVWGIFFVLRVELRVVWGIFLFLGWSSVSCGAFFLFLGWSSLSCGRFFLGIPLLKLKNLYNKGFSAFMTFRDLVRTVSLLLKILVIEMDQAKSIID